MEDFEKKFGEFVALTINGGQWDKDYTEEQKQLWYKNGKKILNYVRMGDPRVRELKRDSEWLACLDEAGVDNWSGIEYAIQLQNEKDPF